MKGTCRWLLLLLVSAVGGCTTAPNDAASARAALDVWVSDIRDGETSTKQIVAKLGEPTASYENGRILVYRLLHDGNLISVLSGADRHRFFEGTVPRVMHGDNPIDEKHLSSEWDFVAEFDGKGILSRHSMLPFYYVWDTRYYEMSPQTAPPPRPAGVVEVE